MYSTNHLGWVKPGSTIYIPFPSYAAATNAPAAMTGLAVSDIRVYKDGGTTERASTAGFTLLDTDGLDFDALTGINGISINLADNTTAGFWTAGSTYWVVVGDVTVDTQTTRFVVATFGIGMPGAITNTTIASLTSQTVFTLTTGPAEDDALNGSLLYLHDIASAVQGGYGYVYDYTGSTKTVTMVNPSTFTLAAGDNVCVLPRTDVFGWVGSPVQPPTMPGVPEVDAVARLGSALSGSEASLTEIGSAPWSALLVDNVVAGSMGQVMNFLKRVFGQ